MAERGLRLPLVPVRHQLFVTEPIPGVDPYQPIVRMLEASVYVRYDRGGLMFGGYEDHPLVVDLRERPPGFQIADLPLDLGVLRAAIAAVREQLDHHFLDEVPGVGAPTLENLCAFIHAQIAQRVPQVHSVSVQRKSSGDRCVYTPTSA